MKVYQRIGVVVLSAAAGFGWVSFWLSGDDGRGPAAVPASLSFPVRIVCSGPAIADHVFQFSPEPGLMKMVYDAKGAATINGQARLTLRGRGDDSEFDGLVEMTGTRSSDGRVYTLSATVQGAPVTLVLEQGGDGRVERMPAGVSPASVYSARCMNAF